MDLVPAGPRGRTAHLDLYAGGAACHAAEPPQAVDATVLGHFFVRFLALVAAFMVWAASVVMSASISTTVQSVIGDSEKEVTALGFNLMLAAVPLVLSILWMRSSSAVRGSCGGCGGAGVRYH